MDLHQLYMIRRKSELPRKARVKSKSGIYHIILRGANKQEIFHDDQDCVKFLQVLEAYKQRCDIKVFAWCLMNNHVHLLLKEGKEEISNTMKRIGISFVSYYNKKYRTIGPLFQDRFKSENVETNRYLLTVTRYIHQNPVKAGLVRQADAWKWSSCSGYYGVEYFPQGLLDYDLILSLFAHERTTAIDNFKLFNEQTNHEQCMQVYSSTNRKTDNEARIEVKELLGRIEIAQVKSLPRQERNEMLRRIKKIDGISQRQIARILGVSESLVFRS